MKCLVSNYSCLQNPWLGDYRPQIPVLSVLCPQLNLLNPPPEQNSWVRQWIQRRYGHFEEQKNLLAPPDTEARIVQAWSRFTVPTTLAVMWLSSSSRRESRKKWSVSFSLCPPLSHKLTRFSFSLIAPSKCGFRAASNTIFFNNPPPTPNSKPHAVTSSRVRLTESK